MSGYSLPRMQVCEFRFRSRLITRHLLIWNQDKLQRETIKQSFPLSLPKPTMHLVWIRPAVTDRAKIAIVALFYSCGFGQLSHLNGENDLWTGAVTLDPWSCIQRGLKGVKLIRALWVNCTEKRKRWIHHLSHGQCVSLTPPAPERLLPFSQSPHRHGKYSREHKEAFGNWTQTI